MNAESAKLRIGVAGLGRAFTVMLPTFAADPRVSLVAAADPRAEARVRPASLWCVLHALARARRKRSRYSMAYRRRKSSG